MTSADNYKKGRRKEDIICLQKTNSYMIIGKSKKTAKEKVMIFEMEKKQTNQKFREQPSKTQIHTIPEH